jgi:hypothetical protein
MSSGSGGAVGSPECSGGADSFVTKLECFSGALGGAAGGFGRKPGGPGGFTRARVLPSGREPADSPSPDSEEDA